MRSGNSSTQGGQLVAQKLTSTGRPRRVCKEIFRPSSRTNSTSGEFSVSVCGSQNATKAARPTTMAQIISIVERFFSAVFSFMSDRSEEHTSELQTHVNLVC